MAINTELYEKLKKENDELILKETKTHNDNISLQSKIEELGEIIIGMGSEIKMLNEENEELKVKNKGYEALLLCECGVSIERVAEIKEENKELKKYLTEGKKLLEKYKSMRKDFSSKSGSM